MGVLSLYHIISVQNLNKLYVYHTEEKTVYLENNDEVILQNVYAPTSSDATHILALFLEEEPYIGLFDIESKETTKIFFINTLGEYLGETICIEELKNIQIIPGDKWKVSFIYRGELYRYNQHAEFEKIWKFAGETSTNPYEWIDESQVLLMDEMGILNEWKLYLYNVNSSTREVIEENVSAFDYSEGTLVYGKKYYKGAWCEWDACIMNLEEEKVQKTIKSPLFDIELILMDSDDKIYYMESKSLYQILNSLLSRKKLAELEEKEILIGIYPRR